MQNAQKKRSLWLDKLRFIAVAAGALTSVEMAVNGFIDLAVKIINLLFHF